VKTIIFTPKTGSINSGTGPQMSSIPSSSTTAGVSFFLKAYFSFVRSEMMVGKKSGSDCVHLTIHCVIVKYLAGYIYYRKCGMCFLDPPPCAQGGGRVEVCLVHRWASSLSSCYSEFFVEKWST
jgi:hypothetical protein